MSITHTENISQYNYIDVNMIFANNSEDNEIFPLTVTEIARAQSEDKMIKIYFTKNSPNDYNTQIYESTEVICMDGKLVIL